MMFSRSRKFENFLIWFTLFFGFIKIVQFLVYVYLILTVIHNEDCIEPCIIEYLELTFVVSVFLPLSLLIYGVVKLQQSFIGLWLVFHVILLTFHCFVQYLIRFSEDRDEYTVKASIEKTAGFIFDLISFYIICKLNFLLINERAVKYYLKENVDSK